MSDQETVGLRLEEAIHACVPDDTVVTGYVVVVEYADAELRYLDVLQSEGLTPWLKDGMLNAAQGWEDND